MAPSDDTPPSLQTLIERLSLFWAERGCAILAPHDAAMGAGTFHPATGLRALGPTPWKAAYLQPCRRPTDGRYGENPHRLQHYYQYQVILKPSPEDVQDLYLRSLEAIGITPAEHDIRFVEDDWESPTMGAWGLGWEVWCDGMEVSQFTYMQQIGGFDLDPISAELTYGIERLAMYIQNVDDVFDLRWNDSWSYRQLFARGEKSWSHYHFERADIPALRREFAAARKECGRCLDESLPGGALIEPAWDQVLRASHLFNILDARGVIGGVERQKIVGEIRALAHQCAQAWLRAEPGEESR